jgi:hypothetical protein
MMHLAQFSRAAYSSSIVFEMVRQIEQIFGTAYNTVLFFGLLFGVVSCFFGYRIFRFIVALIGFAIGAGIGAIIGGLSGGGDSVLAIGLILGFVGAGIAWSARKLGVFLLGFAVGAPLLGVLAASTGNEGSVLVAMLFGGVVGGVIAVAIDTVIIVLSTAFSGGFNIAMALGFWMWQAGAVQAGSLDGAVLGLTVLLGVAGSYVQFKTMKKHPAPDRSTKVPEPPGVSPTDPDTRLDASALQESDTGSDSDTPTGTDDAQDTNTTV